MALWVVSSFTKGFVGFGFEYSHAGVGLEPGMLTFIHGQNDLSSGGGLISHFSYHSKTNKPDPIFGDPLPRPSVLAIVVGEFGRVSSYDNLGWVRGFSVPFWAIIAALAAVVLASRPKGNRAK